MTTIISSQRFRDENIIQEKIENGDYEVALSPVFEIDGEEYQIVLDGHHSHSAAVVSGTTPEYVEYDEEDHDGIIILNNGDIDGFMFAVHMGNDYYDINTGVDVW